MSNSTRITLDEAVAAARELPEAAQAELAVELMEWVEEVSAPRRSAEQQAVIRDRLSRPLKAIPRDAIVNILRRYNPAL